MLGFVVQRCPSRIGYDRPPECVRDAHFMGCRERTTRSDCRTCAGCSTTSPRRAYFRRKRAASSSFRCSYCSASVRSLLVGNALCSVRPLSERHGGRSLQNAIGQTLHYFPLLLVQRLKRPPNDDLPASAAPAAPESPESAFAKAMIDCVTAAFGALSISGTPLLRASMSVR
jgi:hypothetical protein